MTAIRGAAAITGAASGIGRALAIELARRGCDLALADRDEAGLKMLAAEIGPDRKISFIASMSPSPPTSPSSQPRRLPRIRSSASSSTMPAWR
jgi:NAD(P)-dependent dehydrogenase (short-subunit alcohol dehydrogenase family)